MLQPIKFKILSFYKDGIVKYLTVINSREVNENQVLVKGTAQDGSKVVLLIKKDVFNALPEVEFVPKNPYGRGRPPNNQQNVVYCSNTNCINNNGAVVVHRKLTNGDYYCVYTLNCECGCGKFYSKPKFKQD